VKKKLLLVSFIILFGFTPKNCRAKYSGGDGSEATPYRISDANDMNAIGLHEEDWGSHFVMVNDVNLAQFTGTQFNIIGYWVSSYDNNSFTGDFDGNGHTISNFTYQTNGGYIGLLGYVTGASAKIKNLGLIDPNVNAGTGDKVGSLVGSLFEGTVSNCYVEGGQITGHCEVGGLVGDNSKSTISNCYAAGTVCGTSSASGGLVGNNYGTILDCYSTASVSGKQWAGGLVGMNKGTISNCYAAGTVCGTFRANGGLVGINEHATVWNCYASGPVDGNNETGGLVGYNSYSTISNCYATGDVSGNNYVGGLVGLVSYNGTVEHSYAAGAVTGNEPNTGGLVGHHSSGSYTKCFWDSNVNPDVNGIGNTTDPNVIGKSTAEMQTKGTFTDVGWDFVSETVNGCEDIWRLCNDGIEYPKLAWEYTLGDFVCPDGVDMRDYTVLANQWQLETLSYDVAPAGGDGIVNLLDWAVFANGWQDTTDANDLRTFCEQWLSSSAYSADIAPTVDGDGWVNELDLAIMANHWLTGLQ